MGRAYRSSSPSRPRAFSLKPVSGRFHWKKPELTPPTRPGREVKLKNWLHNFLDKQPGIRVFAVERHWKKHAIHCRFCGANFAICPDCAADLGRSAEKTVDSRIVTDMLSLTLEGGYDIALLLSSDRDFLPAVERLQSKNFKVVNATWRGAMATNSPRSAGLRLSSIPSFKSSNASGVGERTAYAESIVNEVGQQLATHYGRGFTVKNIRPLRLFATCGPLLSAARGRPTAMGNGQFQQVWQKQRHRQSRPHPLQDQCA